MCTNVLTSLFKSHWSVHFEKEMGWTLSDLLHASNRPKVDSLPIE